MTINKIEVSLFPSESALSNKMPYHYFREVSHFGVAGHICE